MIARRALTKAQQATILRNQQAQLNSAGFSCDQNLDGGYEFRSAANGQHYMNPKGLGASPFEALINWDLGQRLCATVGCDLPFDHTKLLSPTNGEHHAVGPKTRADWALHKAERFCDHAPPTQSGRTGWTKHDLLPTDPLPGRSLQNY